MNDELFTELLKSVHEGGAILRGEKEPSRRFEISTPTGPKAMDSIANRILKARQYADEKNERIRVQSFAVELQGEHDSHNVVYDSGQWNCACSEFKRRGICAHVMAMEEILGDTVETVVIKVPLA